jgi:hypothetical protein
MVSVASNISKLKPSIWMVTDQLEIKGTCLWKAEGSHFGPEDLLPVLLI